MKNFKTLFAVFAMSLFSLTAFAATEDELIAISSDFVFVADDVTSDGTVGLTKDELYADGHILSAGWNGNSVATNKGSIAFASGGTHLNSLRLKNSQNMLAFKVSGPCTVTFYTYSDAQRGIRIHKVKRANNDDASYYLEQPASTPIWEASLDEAGVYYLSSYNDDFFFAGFEIIFPDDPADVYTFGLTSEIVGTEIQSVGTRASGCSHVETSALQATYQTLNNRTLYHGTTDAFTAPVAHRNMNLNSVLIKTQNGEENGAENHDAYMAFTLNIEEDYSLTLREIASDLYVEAKSNWYYEYVVENANGDELYKSPVQTIAAGQSGSGHTNSVSLRWDADLQGLTGEVTVKLIWWINSTGTTLALKDFNVTGVLKASANPHVEFGMGREFEDATHFEAGVEKLIGSPAHVTVALHNGAGMDQTAADKALYHGTSDNAVTAPTAYRNFCYATQQIADAEFLDNLYWGFSVDIPTGYTMSISQLYGDMYAEKNQIQYKMGVFSSDADDAEPLFMSEVKQGNIKTLGADNVAMTVNTAEVAALQNLTGKIYLRFYWNIASIAAYAALKDFKIRALIESVPGEGVEGLVFESFEAAAHPSFTEGEVTAVWSNSANNVTPASENRGIRVQAGYNYQMQLNVPADSYISEVVFVWNSNGNKNAGLNDDYYIDFTVTNSNAVQVSTLQAPDKKNETVWSCGDLRESQLTFTQGAGDFYCHSIRVTYLKKPIALSYVRPFAHSNLNTLCYPYQIDSYEGATFYTLLYKEMVGSDVTCVYLQEHIGALAAGTPYFYMPNDGASELVCHYSGERENTPKNVNGLQGSYEDNAAVPVDAFVTYNGELRKAGANVTLGEYRAYVNMNDVAIEAGPNYVPGRRMLSIRNANAPQSPTGVENVQGDKVQCTKVIENGQLYIMYKGTMYNVQGQIVK